MLRRIVTAAAFFAACAAAHATDPMAPDMAVLDPDGDGGIGREEAHLVANKLWDVISPNWWELPEYIHTGQATLKEAELAGRLDGDDYAQFNANGDFGIDMAEWAAVVDARFDAADADHDGRIVLAEFASGPGQRLLLLLQ